MIIVTKGLVMDTKPFFQNGKFTLDTVIFSIFWSWRSGVDCSSAKTSKGFKAKATAAARGSKLNCIVSWIVYLEWQHGNTIANHFHLYFSDSDNIFAIDS